MTIQMRASALSLALESLESTSRRTYITIFGARKVKDPKLVHQVSQKASTIHYTTHSTATKRTPTPTQYTTMTLINIATVLTIFTCFHLLPVGAAPLAEFREVNADGQGAGVAALRGVNANAISDAVSEQPRPCRASVPPHRVLSSPHFGISTIVFLTSRSHNVSF